MPRKGRQRSERQKAHAVAMQKRRWLPKSPVIAKTIDSANGKLLFKERKKHSRELKKARKLELSMQKREQRAQEKQKKAEQELQVWVEEVAEEAKERYEEQAMEWRREKADLKKDLARLKARDRREPSKIQHAVQAALHWGQTSLY